METFEKTFHDFTTILKGELLTALGCTEPICIAYCAAVMRHALGAEPEKIRALCSGNLIKNAKGATVPNSGGMKGISASAVLGAVGGCRLRCARVGWLCNLLAGLPGVRATLAAVHGKAGDVVDRLVAEVALR